MNFVRYEKTRIVIGDTDPKRLQKMVDGYRTRGYNVLETLGKLFKGEHVYYKIISL